METLINIELIFALFRTTKLSFSVKKSKSNLYKSVIQLKLQYLCSQFTTVSDSVTTKRQWFHILIPPVQKMNRESFRTIECLNV